MHTFTASVDLSSQSHALIAALVLFPCLLLLAGADYTPCHMRIQVKFPNTCTFSTACPLSRRPILQTQGYHCKIISASDPAQPAEQIRAGNHIDQRRLPLSCVWGRELIPVSSSCPLTSSSAAAALLCRFSLVRPSHGVHSSVKQCPSATVPMLTL